MTPAASSRDTRRLLVTGGAGFVGVHLVRALLAQGHQVVVLDDFSAPSSLGLAAAPKLEVLRADVRDPAAVERAAAEVSQIVHLASVVGVDAVLADPTRTDSVIREGSACVWAVARQRRTPLLFLSSSEVTDAPRRGPRAVYAEAKRQVESLLLQSDDAELATIVRPFNVVGPGQTAPGMVLPALVAAARDGRPLPIHGDGSQQRSFLHVRDFCDTLVELLATPERSAARVLEVGSPERTSIAGLAERLRVLAGLSLHTASEPAPEAREDRPRRAPQLEALRELVAFTPRHALDDILAEAWSHV